MPESTPAVLWPVAAPRPSSSSCYSGSPDGGGVAAKTIPFRTDSPNESATLPAPPGPRQPPGLLERGFSGGRRPPVEARYETSTGTTIAWGWLV